MRVRRIEQCRNLSDLRELARRRLPSPVFDFLDGGADDEWSLRRNVEAFSNYALVPRVLAEVGTVDPSTQVLGQRLAFPVFLSPTGGSRLFHEQAERAVARAAAQAGVLYCLAMFGTVSLEDVAQVAAGPKVFQLYLMRDRALNAELVRRCRAAGYAALCITVDCAADGNRERDLHWGLNQRPRRLGRKALCSLLARPAWAWRFIRNPHVLPATFLTSRQPTRAQREAALRCIEEQWHPAASWGDAAFVIREWHGPVAIKGILSTDDARRAVDIGASAVIVSNHGGRQLDGAISPIDALPQIVEAVGDHAEVIVDGGTRRGTHVLKALALGARACMIGRPYLHGLAAAGEAGVAKALSLLRAEVERGMRLLGCRSVADIDSRLIRSG